MQRPRGTRDLYGEELQKIRFVQERLEGVFRRYGYQEIETPIFEELELFTQKSGSEVLEQIYNFEDKSKRNMALRPELTAPSIRFYNNRLKSEPKPLKIFYSGPCFRYERPQSQRWRQFMQAGVELIGSRRAESDAEIISLSSDCMREVGLESYKLQIGHIGLLRNVLSEGGVSRGEQDPVLRAVDSGDENRLQEELGGVGLCGDIRDTIVSLINLRGGGDVLGEAGDLLGDVRGSEGIIEGFRKILRRTHQMGVKEYEINLGISRGLEYYTGCVFEIYSDDVQIGGGGRYDDLIEALGGDSTPAVGVGLGVDRIAKKLGTDELEGESMSKNVMLMPIGDSMVEEGLGLATELRGEGFSVDFDLKGRSLSKSMNYADTRGINFAIIVGPNDLSKGLITIKNMKTGEQEKIPKDETVEKLRSKIEG